ncbi:MAG: response regulator [Bacteroidota bacterium]|jgi:DNA-binding response OmpR family regulator
MEEIRILIVDDSRLIGERLRRLFEGIAQVASVDYECDLEVARIRIQTLRPAILVLDHHFPSGYGEDLLKSEGEQLKETHVIVYSAFGSMLNHAHYRGLGAHWIFDKSESPEALVTLVESIIRIRSKKVNHTNENGLVS